jgi:hypothetical protein
MTRSERIDLAVRNVLARSPRRWVAAMIENTIMVRIGRPEDLSMPLDFFPAVRLEYRKLCGLPVSPFLMVR